MSHRYARTLVEVTADVTKTTNTDFLDSDFQLSGTGARRVMISVAFGSNVRARLIPNSGSGFSLNGGSAIGSAAVHTETVLLDAGRTWNVQTDDPSGATCRMLIVQEVDN